jgi:hypothetical protein
MIEIQWCGHCAYECLGGAILGLPQEQRQRFICACRYDEALGDVPKRKGENMAIRVWQLIENGTNAQRRMRNRGPYPSAWLANNKALRLRSKGQACDVEATEVADNQQRDFLGGRLALLWRRLLIVRERYRRRSIAIR